MPIFTVIAPHRPGRDRFGLPRIPAIEPCTAIVA
jgi:hypothetical protein